MRHPLIYLLALALTFPLLLSAHDGEDHGEKKPAPAAMSQAYYSAEAVSDKYEVLLKYSSLEPGKPAELTLFLSNANSNLPISGATLKLSNPDDPNQVFDIHLADSGTYAIHTTFAKGAKPARLQITIDAKLGPDLIQVSNLVFGGLLHPDESADAPAPWLQLNTILAIVAALLVGLLAGLFIRRKSKIPRIAVVLIFTLTLPRTLNLYAHGGEDHGKPVATRQSNLSGQIAAPKETQFLFEIETAKMTSSGMSPSKSLRGTVVPTAAGAAVVQSPQSGILRNLRIQVGQTVAKGQALATIEPTVDANTQVGWITQRNSLEAENEAAKKDLDRLQGIRDIVATKDLDEAKRRYETSKSNLDAFLKLLGQSGSNRLLTLYAPISGKVERFNFAVGATVNTGQDIFQITNLDKVYIEAQVWSQDFAALAATDSFAVQSQDPGQSLVPVRRIALGQSIDPSNQSYKALFEVDNAEGRFRLGQFVDIGLIQETLAGSITIPDAAIVELYGKPAAWVKESAERFRLQYLSITETPGPTTEIITTLPSGAKLVTNGAYQLKMMSPRSH
jgi:membrane fusion protein, heavy metal efflux system